LSLANFHTSYNLTPITVKEQMLSHRSFIFPKNPLILFFFFFNDTPTTEIYTLSLHDALPIYIWTHPACKSLLDVARENETRTYRSEEQRLNSSHVAISYAVFCLKKKNIREQATHLIVQKSRKGKLERAAESGIARFG